VELEENLRRSDLTWSEPILGKQRLFNLMRSIHGEATMGRGNEGFGVRSLAAMLGENPSTTSRDLELAGFVERHPMLAKLPTAADARRKLGVAVTVAAMQSLAKTSTVKPPDVETSSTHSGLAVVVAGGDRTENPDSLLAPPAALDERWCLYEGRFQDNITALDDNSIDLICTDLPYNIGLGDSSASHSAGLGGFSDSDIDIAVLCSDVAVQSYRVLRDNRFAVFFFGMSYYEVLRETLITASFTVDPYPFIWLRDRTAPPDGFARYSKTWDPALIASKGVPRFIRPNQGNSIAIPSVRGAERLHAAQKPVNVMQKFIEDMTTPGCIVLDMFAGAGTTGVAALNTGRKVVLFELEPANCVLIKSRLGVL
jgi:site-specific DNA-methyltransferase (adenine-specific)